MRIARAVGVVTGLAAASVQAEVKTSQGAIEREPVAFTKAIEQRAPMLACNSDPGVATYLQAVGELDLPP